MGRLVLWHLHSRTFLRTSHTHFLFGQAALQTADNRRMVLRRKRMRSVSERREKSEEEHRQVPPRGALCDVTIFSAFVLPE